MSIETEGDKPGSITSEQVEAFRFLLDHEASVAESIFRAICSAYPEIREECADDLEEAGQIMPEIRRPEDLRPLIGLAQIHLLRVAAAGQGYVGFELGCIWDSEHGLGVMTHRDRVVEIAGADTSFLWWIADEDSRSAQ